MPGEPNRQLASAAPAHWTRAAEWMAARPARSYLVFLLAAVLPLGLFFYSAGRVLREQAEERSRLVGTQTALLSAQLVEEHFRQSTVFLEAFASRRLLRQAWAQRDLKEVKRHLEDSHELQPDFAFFSVYDVDGTMRDIYPPEAGIVGRNFAFRDWYRGVSREWKPYVSEVYQTAVAPNPLVVAVAVPLKDETGAPAGIIMAPYTLETIADWMGHVQQEGAWRISVVDQRGRLVAAPGVDVLQAPLDLSGYPPVARLQAGQSGTGVFLRGEEELFVAYTPIRGLAWGLVAERRQALVLQSARAVERQLGLLALVFAGLALGGAALVGSLQARLAKARTGIQQVNTELEAANKELEAFTYSVSHDLRAPLRHIDGFSRLLLEEHSQALPPPARHYLERVRQGTRQMGQLVDDLLNLARVGRQELRRQVTGLGSLVEEARRELTAELEGREVKWRIGALPFVECDPALMKQVFANLLANAAKFSRPRQPAVIEVGSHTENGQPVVFVRDNGVGFSMKYADKLFGVFQRLHRPEDFEGTGVGLATVQRIVRKHGGRVWAEAELDKGATFYFTLQASPSAQALPGEPSGQALPGEPSEQALQPEGRRAASDNSMATGGTR